MKDQGGVAKSEREPSCSSGQVPSTEARSGGPDDQRVELADIFIAAKGGNENAWATLIDRLSSMIRAIARSYRLNYDDIGEITQTAWLRLFENTDHIRDPHAVGAWLAVTARRECMKAARARLREQCTDAELVADALGGGDDDLEMPMVKSARREALLGALEKLPVHQSLLLRALMVEPTPSYEAISRTLRLPIGSIGPTRGRALARLRQNGALRAVVED